MFVNSAPRHANIDLGIVAHHHHVPMLHGEQVDDLGLQPVRVLIFVDQDVLKLFGVKVGDRLVFSISSLFTFSSRSS